MGEAKRKRNQKENFLKQHPWCCFCGGAAPATTVDHIPSRQMFSLRRRPKGLEVPACEVCNQATRLHEQIAAMLGRVYQPNAFWVVGGASIVLLIAISQKPDEVLEGFYRQLKRAQDQFSGARPAVLWARIEGVDHDEWPKLKSKSGLEAMSYRYLGRSSKLHICALAYSSGGKAVARGAGIQKSGPMLYFDHKESPYYNEKLDLLFAP